MEADMAVEGFSQSVDNIRYLKFVADGDSSVFAKIKQNVPYDNDVKKIECTNHALNNYGKYLRKIKTDKNIHIKGRKLLTLKKIEALTKQAKYCIYEHAKSEIPDVKKLQTDFKLSIHHVCGDHEACQEPCGAAKSQSINEVPALKSTFMYSHLQGALNLLIRKSLLLITNKNNNAAERLMNIVSRFTMGKRLNLIQRGSYTRRVYLASLRYNKSFKWHYSPWKNFTSRSPGIYFASYMAQQETTKEGRSRKRFFSDTEKKIQKKSKTIQTDCGAFVEEPETVEELNFIIEESKSIIERLQVTKEVHEIKKKTVGQFGNQVFEQERALRLTASLFGKVLNRRLHTPCHSLVKACLKPTLLSSEAVQFGVAKEAIAIKKFQMERNLKVTASGLWVHEEHGFLGASPDGLVGDNATVEVKCIYAPHKTFDSIEELIPQLKNPFLTNGSNGIILKRQHNYYFQVQGQLEITKREKCYFIVYVNDRVPIHVEEIYRDKDLWNSTMLPKLEDFTNLALLLKLLEAI